MPLFPQIPSLLKSAPRSSRTERLCIFGALCLVCSTGWLLNRYGFVMFDTVSPWIREASTTLGGLAVAVLAIAMRFYPLVASRATRPQTVMATWAMGVFLILAGLRIQSAPLVIAGASLVSATRCIASMVVGIACLAFNPRSVAMCIAGSCIISCALEEILALLPFWAGALLSLASTPFMYLLSTQVARPRIERISAEEAPAQVALTQPSTLVPFGSQLFLCLLLFQMSYGFALTFGEVDRIPLETGLACIPLVALLGKMALSPQPLDLDLLFRLTLLFIITGFLTIGIPGLAKGALANTLLMSAEGFYTVLFWTTLIGLGRRSEPGAPSAIAWGLAINAIGVTLGANAGRIANDLSGHSDTAISVISSAIVLLFVVYILLIARTLSFRETIAKVESRHAVVALGASSIDHLCTQAGAQFSLTPREVEVLMLLSRGRSGPYIQEKLCVSYNTVKAHVKHIYQKTGVHTQQELIDLVENIGESTNGGT